MAGSLTKRPKRAFSSRRGTRGHVNPRRLEAVERLLVQCYTHSEIAHALAEQWKCTRRTVERYIDRVHEEWKRQKTEISDDSREQNKRALMDAYKHNYVAATETAECASCSGTGRVTVEKKQRSCVACFGRGQIRNPASASHWRVALRALHQLAYLDGLYDSTVGIPKGPGGAVIIMLPEESEATPRALVGDTTAEAPPALPAEDANGEDSSDE